MRLRLTIRLRLIDIFVDWQKRYRNEKKALKTSILPIAQFEQGTIVLCIHAKQCKMIKCLNRWMWSWSNDL